MAKPTRYTPEMFQEYTEKGYWESMTLSDYWNKTARDYPDMEAVVDSRTRLTWSQANQWIDRLALGFLELVIKRDELILVALPPCAELYLLRVACERAGVLCLPLPMHWRHREVEHVISLAEPVGVVTRCEFRGFNYLEMFRQLRLKHLFVVGDEVAEGTISIKEMVSNPVERRYPPDYLEGKKSKADEFSLIVTTTGTTGFPKLVENPICSRIYMAKAFIKRYKVTAEDIIGIIIPAVGGLNHVAYFGAPMLPAKVVILEHFSPEAAFQLIEKERITFTGGVPTALAQMVRDPSRSKYDLSSMRLLNSAGSAMSYELGVEAEEKLGFPVTQCFASMDHGGWTCVSAGDSREVLYRTVGKPFDGNEIRIVDDAGEEVPKGGIGELCVRGPTLVSGYYRDPKATWEVWSRDGWCKTGDLCKVDDDECVVVVGRKRDMVIRGGQNIYPIEIESLLSEHPRVSDIAIIAMPDPVMGERACAYVVPKPGSQFTFDEMASFLKEKSVAPYKLPERLEIVSALPKIGDQIKTDKKVLEQDIKEKLKAEGKL